MRQIDKDVFIETCENSKSMREASIKLDIPFTTFARYAKKFKVYKTNQSGKGINKPSSNKIPLDDILNGKYPNYGTHRMKMRLFDEGYKERKCEECGLTKWNNKSIPFELDHVDGNSSNNVIENLKILCPNCHSQTATHAGKNNVGKKKNKIVDDDVLLKTIFECDNIHQALNKLKMSPTTGSYKRCYKLLDEYAGVLEGYTS